MLSDLYAIAQNQVRTWPQIVPGTIPRHTDHQFSAGPLNVGAGNPQERRRKAPFSCNATFSMLQCNFCLLQRSVLSEWRPHCSKVNVAVQLLQRNFQNLQCNFGFRLWHVAGVGFRGGGGLRLAEIPLCAFCLSGFSEGGPSARVLTGHELEGTNFWYRSLQNYLPRKIFGGVPFCDPGFC